ncbi:hypothetical protein FACS1894200_07460 [Spirochaetia bacterium]|nr:hypothetical protein FACS1894200_07460 [Spirochaetia bacterium]
MTRVIPNNSPVRGLQGGSTVIFELSQERAEYSGVGTGGRCTTSDGYRDCNTANIIEGA